MTNIYQKLLYTLRNDGGLGSIDSILEQVLLNLGGSPETVEGKLVTKRNPPWDAGLGAGVEGSIFSVEDVSVPVRNPKAGTTGARGSVEPETVLAVAPYRTETAVNLNYERGHRQRYPDLITRVTGTIGDVAIDLIYERFFLGQGSAKLTKIAGKIGVKQIEIMYNHPFQTADVYVDGRRIHIRFDEGKRRRA